MENDNCPFGDYLTRVLCLHTCDNPGLCEYKTNYVLCFEGEKARRLCSLFGSPINTALEGRLAVVIPATIESLA